MYQLGHDQDEDEALPRKVESLSGKVLSISAGGQHSAVVMKLWLNDDDIFLWWERVEVAL